MATVEDINDRIKRSVNHEFVRLEEDFDQTRDDRKIVSEKLMHAVKHVNLVDEDGNLSSDAEVVIKLTNLALKALSDTEKANAMAVGLKLRNQEQEMASAAAAKERIELVLRATAPGRITEPLDLDDIDQTLEARFEGVINDFELKSNPRDLAD